MWTESYLNWKCHLQGREWKEGSPFMRLQGKALSLRGCIQLLGWDKGWARSTLFSGCRMNKENAGIQEPPLNLRIVLFGFQWWRNV